MSAMRTSRPMRFRSSPRQHEHGAAAVEFSLVLIPLLVLAFGVVEYGRAIYHYDIVAKSVRAASRLVAAYDPSDTTSFSNASTHDSTFNSFQNSPELFSNFFQLGLE